MTNPATISATIWIVDRDPRRRTALARLAGSVHHTVSGAPEDSQFASAALPSVVLIGLSSSFETELDFVHRMRERAGDCGWILIAPEGDRSELERLFDTLEAKVLSWPPPTGELRHAIRSLARVRTAAPLSQRSGRESLSARFARWFSGDELHMLLRTLDPSLATVPILVRGETGTGRRLLARYIHAFGSEPSASFAPLFCEGVQTASQLLSQLDVAGPRSPGQPTSNAITIWLDEVDRLPLAIQKQLHGWIHFGAPADANLSNLRIRWTASTGEEASECPGRRLDPGLAQALSGLVVRLAPLRDQPAAIERFVHDTARSWCEERGSHLREFDSESLRELMLYPWPGNLSELESVIVRTLANSASPTITPLELSFDASGDVAAQPLFDTRPSVETNAIQEAEPAAPMIEAEPPETGGGAPEIGEARVESAAEETSEEEIVVEAEFEPHELDYSQGEGEREADVEGELETAIEAALDDGRGSLPLAPAVSSDDSWSQILRAVAHEVRNPLVSIRTFSELLSEHHEDPDFRARFSELVGADVRRIEGVVTRLQELSELSHAKRQPVDLAGLLDDLLEERRGVVEERRLLVLKELDTNHPIVLGDSQLLRGAFEGILNRALEWVPEHGDLYLATAYRPQSPGERASVRVLLRFQGTSAMGSTTGSATGYAAPHGQTPTLAESTLEFVAARAVIRGLGGTFTCDATDRETVVVIDLPAPAQERASQPAP